MNLVRLVHRSLRYYWRTNLATTAGVATAVAVLGGALLVGSSVRASLLDLVLRRLGATEYVVTAGHLFGERLAAELSASLPGIGTCPLIHLQGVVTHERSGLRAHQVDVFAIDDRFWRFHGLPGRAAPRGREALVGETLARELHSGPGDTLLIRIEGEGQVPKESLFGRRDDAGHTFRMSCSGELGAEELGEFSLQHGRQRALAVFVPLTTIRKALAEESGANTILVSAPGAAPGSLDLDSALRSKWDLTDAGVRLRPAPAENVLNVESPAVLLSDSLAEAALRAASNAGVPASPLCTYLANTIRCGGHEIPYSVISAVDLGRGALSGIETVPARGSVHLQEEAEPLWLNEWARDELKPAPGGLIQVSYFIWRDEARLETGSASFVYAGTVATGSQAGPSFAPVFPGITDAATMGGWDPPFPLDMKRIRPQDERYWDLYRTTPKAFIRLDRGRQLWGTRFGGTTAIRLAPRPGSSLEQLGKSYGAVLLALLRPELSGFEIRNLREEGVAAARGSTDFGQYFLYFSFFLIAAAVLLAALFFRLGIEQRVREVGTLLAEGYTDAQVRAIFLLEGSVLAACGTLLGLPLAAAYASLLMHGLGTWWVGASGTTELHLHISGLPLLLGAAAGFSAALVATAAGLRTFGRASTRTLLSGTIESRGANRSRAPVRRLTLLATAAAAAGFMAAARLGGISEVSGFFAGGGFLLAAALSATSLYLRRETPPVPVRPGRRGLLALGIRYANHRPGRSLSCITLIACAIFVIVSLEAFRTAPGLQPDDPHSGTGGFALQAESTLPLVADLNSPTALEDLGFPQAELRELSQVRFVPFRLKPGDDASCLSLYAPQEPRILGVPALLTRSGRFSFTASRETKAEPWRLLESPLESGAIPAITDSNTAEFILHKSVGEDVTVRDGRGASVRLRLVATLRGSIFQRELLISEHNFVRLFPDRQGFRFFLLDLPPLTQAEVARLLEERLSDWGFDVRSTSRELASFHEVEDTYLSTFQSLGGLGLILGTIGLAAVLLRNVLERRRELALLRAVGFPRAALGFTVVLENAALLILGVFCGTLCALLAVSPALAQRAGTLPLVRLLLLTGSVCLVGLGASLLAVAAAFRSPLLPALRSE